MMLVLRFPMDCLSPEQRSVNMSRIRGRNTSPELVVRKALHAAGLRFRLHGKDLPGRPDIVLPRYRTALFVHGCFWHCHEGCPVHRIPGTRREFWESKLNANVERDERDQLQLVAAGWRVLVVWECALRGSRKLPLQELVQRCRRFLTSKVTHKEIEGTP